MIGYLSTAAKHIKFMVDQKEDQAASGDGKAGSPEAGKPAGGPHAIVFPPDKLVWNEARRLIANKDIRVEDLAICAAQDPVIVIELLKISNAMFFSGGRSPITSTKTAIMRLGSQVVLDTLEKMSDRLPFADEAIAAAFEVHRHRARRTAIIATLFAEALNRTLSEDCQVAGLLLYVGEMLAVAHFGSQYVALSEDLSRSSINYRLATDHKFDVEKMGVTYLRRNGIPEAVLFAIDRDARPRSAERAIMRPLCAAAAELVDTFDNNRWEKFAPGKNIPPKSALRMLQMSESQYLKIYERASEYLFSARALEERKKQVALNETLAAVQVHQDKPAHAVDKALEAEIQSILEAPVEAAPAVEPPKVAPPIKPPSRPGFTPTKIEVTDIDLDAKDQFSLETLKTQKRDTARMVKPTAKVAPPKLLTTGATKVMSEISSMFDNAKRSEDLLAQLLEMLVDQGPFEKSALIVVSKDRKTAIVVAARGPDIGNGQKLVLEDPLSPLAQCFSKVQSFGNKMSPVSPFGSKSFAVAPIDADHDTPVALYADCGNEGSVSFEARRIFRNVVEVLNQKLPTIPGGIPVELLG